nr:hypothetical protein [Tanacetum cinerariifolium]
MAPTRRTTWASPATTTTTTPVTNAHLKALIDQGVADALTILKNQVKFATCTLHGVSLTWRKSHVKTVGQDVAHDMPWSTLMKMMTAKYCLQNEIKKLKIETWELKVKGTDVTSYTQHFRELALLCGRMFPEESDKIEKYVGGLPDMIHESVMASKPKTTAYTVGPGEKKPYGESKPLCYKYNYHYDGLCAPKCHKCNKVGLLTRDCRSPAATNNQRNLTCYECGNQGHYRSDYPELKNQTMETKLEGKLNLRYVRPFKVLAKVGAVAYKLELPQELSRVYNTFHVSNLKKYYANEPLAVPLDELHINDRLYFVEEPIEIID